MLHNGSDTMFPSRACALVSQIRVSVLVSIVFYVSPDLWLVYHRFPVLYFSVIDEVKCNPWFNIDRGVTTRRDRLYITKT